MSLKQTGKGNKSSEPEDNTAYREATTETIPLFIYFNSSPTFKAMKTAGSAYPALQILHFSLCSVCGNKWTFSPFQLKFVGPLPWPSTTQWQKGERTLHHRFQQWVALTEQGTVWCANVAPEYTPQAALSQLHYPNYPNSGQHWQASKPEHFQLSAHILSLHWLFTTSKSPPVISKSNTHFSSVYCRPSAASPF